MGFYMYGLSDNDVMEIYSLKEANKLFSEQLSIVASKVATLGSKINSLAPDECRAVSNMMQLGLMSAAEITRFQTLQEHSLLEEAYEAEVQLGKLFSVWLPKIASKLGANSLVLRRGYKK